MLCYMWAIRGRALAVSIRPLLRGASLRAAWTQGLRAARVCVSLLVLVQFHGKTLLTVAKLEET